MGNNRDAGQRELATQPTGPAEQAAPDPAAFSSQPAPAAGTAWLLWGVPLGPFVPWRVLPRVHRAPVAPLVAIYLGMLALNWAVTFPFRPAPGAPGWPRMLPGVLYSYAESLLFWFAVLTLAGAARPQRRGEALGLGLRSALLIASGLRLMVSLLLLLYLPVRSSVPYEWFSLLWLAVGTYSLVAATIAAARLAEKEHTAPDTDDPLWPWCVRCDYSLRGLPAVESWRGQYGAGPDAPPLPDETLACPECGTPLRVSLQEQAERLRYAREAKGEPLSIRRVGRLLADMLRFRWDDVIRAFLRASRVQATILWMAGCFVLATAAVFVRMRGPWAITPPYMVVWGLYSACRNMLLWTGLPALLLGLRPWLPVNRNGIWLSHNLVAWAVWVAVPFVVVCAIDFPHLWTQSRLVRIAPLDVLLGLLVLLVELLMIFKARALLGRQET